MNEDDIEVETVTHKARVSAFFGLVVWTILACAFWITSTPKRWIALLVGIACAVGLYFAFR